MQVTSSTINPPLDCIYSSLNVLERLKLLREMSGTTLVMEILMKQVLIKNKYLALSNKFLLLTALEMEVKNLIQKFRTKLKNKKSIMERKVKKVRNMMKKRRRKMMSNHPLSRNRSSG